MKKSPRKCRSQAAFEILSGKDRTVIVAVDFAKRSMKVQAFLDSETVAWKRGLDVENSQAGVVFLLEKLDGILRKWRVSRNRVVFGGEDPASYAIPFIEAVKHQGFLFVAVNAKAASGNRDNTRASSDLLDLDGIAETIRRKHVRDLEASSGIYAALYRASRARSQAKKLERQVENQIHRIVDLVFPGLLEDKATGMKPLSAASLVLLESGVTPAKLRKMKDATVIGLLGKGGAIHREEIVAHLRRLADQALPPPCDLEYLLETLRCKVAVLRAIRNEIACAERQMARSLAQTSCAWMLTLPGIGVALAASCAAELGDPARWRSVAQMFSYAGCAQRHKQTGGPDQEGHSLGMPRDCNHRLKSVLLQMAHHVGITPHPALAAAGLDGEHRLMRHFRKVEARGGKSLLSTARLLLRIVFPMVRQEVPYHAGLPGEDNLATKEEKMARMNITMDTAIAKLKKCDLAGIPDEHNRIHAFRKFNEEYADTIDATHL
jgi:transposase